MRHFVMVAEQYPLPAGQEEMDDSCARPALLMKERGWAVTIAAMALRGQPREEVINGLPVRRFRRSVELLWWLARIKANVVHVQTAGMRPLFIPWVARNVIVTAQNLMLFREWWKRPAQRWMAESVTRILCHTPFDMAQAAPCVREPGKLCLVPRSIDVDFYSQPVDRLAARRDLGLPEHAFVVVHAGDLTEANRPMGLIRGFSKMALEWPAAQLIILGRNGCGPGQRAEMEDLLSEHYMQGRVTFAGYGSRADVRSAFAAADCQINNSAWEGQNLAVHRGFCQKLPASLPKMGSFTSVFRHALYHENEEELALNLLRLAVQPRLRADLGEACFALMPQFDHKVLDPKLLQVYEGPEGDLNSAQSSRARPIPSADAGASSGMEPGTHIRPATAAIG